MLGGRAVGHDAQTPPPSALRGFQRGGRRLLQLNGNGVGGVEHGPIEVGDLDQRAFGHVFEEHAFRRFWDHIDQQRRGAATRDAADVDAVPLGLRQDRRPRVVVTGHRDEGDRYTQLRQADRLIGALAAQQLLALQDRGGIVGRRRPIGTQHQIACDLADHDNAHGSTVPGLDGHGNAMIE